MPSYLTDLGTTLWFWKWQFLINYSSCHTRPLEDRSTLADLGEMGGVGCHGATSVPWCTVFDSFHFGQSYYENLWNDFFNPPIDQLAVPSTLWWTNIAMKNGHLYWIFPLKMVIFHCYVSSPEGTWLCWNVINDKVFFQCHGPAVPSCSTSQVVEP